jgi:hypothetical protein
MVCGPSCRSHLHAVTRTHIEHSGLLPTGRILITATQVTLERSIQFVKLSQVMPLASGGSAYVSPDLFEAGA